MVSIFKFDGEAVVLGVDGISDFNALHSGKYNDEVQLYAFDILALNGDDLRSLRLSMRKAHLERLLTPRPGRHLHQFIRAGRDRPRPFPRGLQHGARGPGLETSRPPLSGRPIEGLGEGEEPQAPGNGARKARLLMIARFASACPAPNWIWNFCPKSPEQAEKTRKTHVDRAYKPRRQIERCDILVGSLDGVWFPCVQGHGAGRPANTGLMPIRDPAPTRLCWRYVNRIAA